MLIGAGDGIGPGRFAFFLIVLVNGMFGKIRRERWDDSVRDSLSSEWSDTSRVIENLLRAYCELR